MKKIAGGERTLFSLFTRAHGKISLAISTHRFEETAPQPLDLFEVEIAEQNRLSVNQIISARHIEKQRSFFKCFSEGTTPLYQKRALLHTAHILARSLTPGEPRDDLWEYIHTLSSLEDIIAEPMALPLLTGTLFLHEEGLQPQDILDKITLLPREARPHVETELKMLFDGNVGDILQKKFHRTTIEFFFDVTDFAMK